MSVRGPFRHFAATPDVGRFRTEADMQFTVLRTCLSTAVGIRKINSRPLSRQEPRSTSSLGRASTRSLIDVQPLCSDCKFSKPRANGSTKIFGGSAELGTEAPPTLYYVPIDFERPPAFKLAVSDRCGRSGLSIHGNANQARCAAKSAKAYLSMVASNSSSLGGRPSL
jgi:hypothetical protein